MSVFNVTVDTSNTAVTESENVPPAGEAPQPESESQQQEAAEQGETEKERNEPEEPQQGDAVSDPFQEEDDHVGNPVNEAPVEEEEEVLHEEEAGTEFDALHQEPEKEAPAPAAVGRTQSATTKPKARKGRKFKATKAK